MQKRKNEAKCFNVIANVQRDCNKDQVSNSVFIILQAESRVEVWVQRQVNGGLMATYNTLPVFIPSAFISECQMVLNSNAVQHTQPGDWVCLQFDAQHTRIL